MYSRSSAKYTKVAFTREYPHISTTNKISHILKENSYCNKSNTDMDGKFGNCTMMQSIIQMTLSSIA